MKNLLRLEAFMAFAIIGAALTSAFATPPPGKPIKCKLVRLKDQATQLIAFSYLAPLGWDTNNQIQWVKPGLYNAVLTCESPDKQYGVIQMEHTVISYGANPRQPPTGIVMHHASDFLKFKVGEIAEKMNAQDLTITEALDQPLPEEKLNRWERPPPDDMMTHAVMVNETGFVQATCSVNGTTMSISAGSVVKGRISFKHLPNRNQILTEGGVFAVGPTTVVVCPVHPDPVKAHDLQLIASSMSITPQFSAYFNKLGAHLAGVVLGANVAATKYADQTFHERSMAQFRSQMAMKDAYTRQFCNYVLDQQDYKDVRGNLVTLPASYQHVWEDGQGDYLVTDDPTVDPRGYGSGTWHTMAKARPGE